MGSLLRHLADLPPWLIYLVIGTGAAIENVIPPVPADTFVLLGAFLSAAGRASPWMVFLVTWLANVGSAVGVYLFTSRYGQDFFTTRIGHFFLKPKQLEQVGRFYQRWGVPAIFVSRFLPAFRAVVPVFAGVTRGPLLRVLPPLAVASGIWYGILVYLGAMAGGNWQRITAFFDRASLVLGIVAALLIAAFVFWWVRSRRESR